MTWLDLETASVVDHALVDEPLLTLDALADAAGRLPDSQVEHHLGDLPILQPGGETRTLDQSPAEVVLGVEANGCRIMLTALATLPAYEALLRRASARFELALRARGERLVSHDLVAFIGAPGATVPAHFDRNHHLLMQVRGSKAVGTGTFADPLMRQRQIERGMQPYRLNADMMPDISEERVLHQGQALVIPAYLFHWVHRGDDVSIAITCVVATETTRRDAAVHRFNLRARRLGLRPAPPGAKPRVDRVKQMAVAAGDRMTANARARRS